MAEHGPEVTPPTTLLEALCPICRRTAYVREGAEMVCPVCSSPLLSVETPPATESQAS